MENELLWEYDPAWDSIDPRARDDDWSLDDRFACLGDISELPDPWEEAEDWDTISPPRPTLQPVTEGDLLPLAVCDMASLLAVWHVTKREHFQRMAYARHKSA